MFKDNFLFHPNKYYKMYGKKFKATVSKAHEEDDRYCNLQVVLDDL
jgi:hypothetical protein